jgi:hypothetical protein
MVQNLVHLECHRLTRPHVRNFPKPAICDLQVLSLLANCHGTARKRKKKEKKKRKEKVNIVAHSL